MQRKREKNKAAELFSELGAGSTGWNGSCIASDDHGYYTDLT
jgi:hypothetical protein